MKYRDSKGRYSYREHFENDTETDGSFEKTSDSVLYTWAPNKNVQHEKQLGTWGYLAATGLGAFFSLCLLLVPAQFNLTFDQGMLGSLDYRKVLLGIIIAVGLIVFIVRNIGGRKFNYSVSSSFVDLDERSSDKRIDMEIQILKNSIQELKSSITTEESKGEEDVNAEDAKTEFHEFSAVEHYIHGITKSLDRHIELSEKKASRLLDTGTMYLRRGIYFYVASIFVWQVVAHVWGVDKQLIFGVVSCSLTFLVVEFLAAWFLKQYRSFIDSSVQFMRVKSVFDRYLLSYYAVKEFSNEEAGVLAESKAQVLKVLAEEIKWPEALNTKVGDMNHMVQMFDSLAGVLEKMKKVSAKNEKAED